MVSAEFPHFGIILSRKVGPEEMVPKEIVADHLHCTHIRNNYAIISYRMTLSIIMLIMFANNYEKNIKITGNDKNRECLFC